MTTRRSPRSVFLILVALVTSSSAAALDRGDVCTLKAPLPMVVVTGAGTIETMVDPGTEISVQVVGDEGRARISTGDTVGLVATRDLEAACEGTLQVCRVESELMLYARTRSDSRSWRIKPGATMSVLRTGKVWAYLRVDDLEGFAKAGELKKACIPVGGGTVNNTTEPEITEEVERGEGPGILFLPLYLEDGAPVGPADKLSDLFFDRLAAYRPDAGRLPTRGERTAAKWNDIVTAAATRARAAGLAYALVGTLGVVKASGSDKGVLTVSLALVDAKHATVLKGARTKPSLRPTDTWPETLMSVLLPFAKQAPGARPPPPPHKEEPGDDVVPINAPAPRTVDDDIFTASPWYANPWGYAVGGAGIVAGVGAGVLGTLALADNDQANALPAIDDERAAQRNQAFTLAAASDALTGVAVVAGITTLVVFVSRAGMDD